MSESYGYTRIYETVDITMVIARHYDRIMDAATRYWSGRHPSVELKALIGAIWALYKLSKPLLKRTELEMDDFFPALFKLAREDMDAAWSEAMDALESLTRALDMEGLLVRKAGLREEGG